MSVRRCYDFIGDFRIEYAKLYFYCEYNNILQNEAFENKHDGEN